ncbi:MAG: M1 family metallopeptidase [Phaeodactylibacter sp.]|nr:M1 family metallopeptidase [Phaeodactylibacter sp.]
MKIFLNLFLAILSVTTALNAQPSFTRQDTLRGSITPERAWWDLTYYHLDIRVNPADSTIAGSNTIQYRVLAPGQRMQIDLQAPMKVEKVVQNGKTLSFQQDGNAWFVELPDPRKPGAIETVAVHYSGRPQVARNPPWDAALSWRTDDNGKPFVATSCQGDGASLWWPCKDHMYDEPDSMLISVRVPAGLMDVSNGRLRGIENNGDGTKTYHWFVDNPINNYGVNVNIGDYVHFSETYQGEKGELDCDYYVLPYNLEKAKEQFRDVPRMLAAFEHWFGPYPFYEDGFKLVEVPYLGMEHQSSVTYGNGFQNGYRGYDLSGSDWGLKFDFIIIHEAGHEWFANSITYKDIADMWVHEGFTAYSENLFLDYHYGKEASADYVIGTRRNIRNDRPIIGLYDVNQSGSGDMYYKGANMLHTLRQVVNDDEKWRSILRNMNRDFYHQTVTSRQIEAYLSRQAGRGLSAFFDQYLRTTMIPALEYRAEGKKLRYRWSNCVDGFDMPVKVLLDGKEQWLEPVAGKWKQQKMAGGLNSLVLDRNFYVTKASTIEKSE